jgi:hypothetical protein
MLKKKNGYGKGTFIETKMFLSEAYLSLGQQDSCPYVSSASVHLLTMLLGKRQFSKVPGRKGSQKIQMRSDDNKFTLTYKEIQSYGSRMNKKGEIVKGMITQPRLTRALDELLWKGFIEIHVYGGAFEKHKSVYGLSDAWVNWHWGDTAIRERKRDFRRGGKGFQGAGKGAVQLKLHTRA